MNQQMPGESIHPRLRTAFRRRKAEYPNSHYLYYDTAGGRMQSHFTIFPGFFRRKMILRQKTSDICYLNHIDEKNWS